MGPIGPPLPSPLPRARGQDIHSISYQIVAHNLVSFLLPSSSFLRLALLTESERLSARRGESSGEKGWRILRKGGADFRPRACPL